MPDQDMTAVLQAAAAQLSGQGVPGAMRDARLLLARALDLDPGRLTLDMPDRISDAENANFQSLIARRAAREPMAQILGAREFFGRVFKVSRDVLDPRPDTETLVEVALEHPFASALDLGTGSGCILLSLLAETPGARGLGTDTSAAALAIATQNATALGLSDHVRFEQADWFEGLTGSYDLIVSNPPYVSEAEYQDVAPEVRDWEPKQAITPGGDGLAPYRTIAAGARAHLRAKGRLIVEVGHLQGAAVRTIFQTWGFDDVSIRKDLNHRDRVVVGHIT